MPRLYRLTATRVLNAPPGKHADGGGLYLYNLRTGPQWVFRFTIAGKRHEMGLGGYPATSLADARKLADKYRAIVKTGGNPIEVRAAENTAIAARIEANSPDARRAKLLNTIAPLAFEAKKPELRDDGKAGRWFSELRNHVLPKIGQMPVDEITGNDIAKALKPIWHEHPEVGRKAITRLGQCLRFARAQGVDVDPLAITDARELLGKQVYTATHIPAMDWQDVPAFYRSLEGGGPVQLALQLLILTGYRSKSTRFAQLDQIEGDIWTVPAPLVKGNKGQTEPFRIPLTPEALRVIECAREISRDGYLFPGVRKGVISDMSMAAHMKRIGLDARPHGFRTAFRIWAEENTNAGWEIKESSIGHKVGNSVSRAYLRTDFLDERRLLAEKWARYLTGEKAVVISMIGARP
jgi:integrase